MLGYGFMGRAHSSTLRQVRHMTWPPPLIPELVSIAGRTEDAVTAAAEEFGFAEHVTDWRALVADARIGLFDNTGPNSVHVEPSIAAAEAGKHIVCEKPLGLTADDSYEAWQRVRAAGVKHMCAFNYRFVPAVRLARELVAAGELGEIVHFRAAYLQDWLVDPSVANLWRLDKSVAGSGALGDLGALGTIEASRSCPSRRNSLRFEINGTGGSVAFNMERLNELEWSEGTGGFRMILVTDRDHPFMQNWWPPGHILGWEHTFVHELHHSLGAIRDDRDVAPHGATFEDGLPRRGGVRRDRRSADGQGRVLVSYRD